MKPLRSNIIIKPKDQLKALGNGIALPAYAKNVLPDRGIVLEVGPDVKDVKKGDFVTFDRFKADNLKDKGFRVSDGNGAYYLVIPEKLVSCVLK